MSKPSQLRLLLFTDCNRNCDGCCNKQWDLTSLPICEDYTGFELIMLTGGEPMLQPNIIKKTICDIKYQNPHAKIILYTSMTKGLEKIIHLLDGITLTLHETTDVTGLIAFDAANDLSNMLLRLNVFENIDVTTLQLSNKWVIKDNIHWLENCPLPKNEVFMRLQ